MLEEENPMETIEIKSPIVGTFFSHGEWSCGPSKKEPVRVGDHVKSNTIVCIIEAMKVPCPIRAGFEGIIIEILVEDGQKVEYDQVLFRLELNWEWNYDLEPESYVSAE